MSMIRQYPRHVPGTPIANDGWSFNAIGCNFGIVAPPNHYGLVGVESNIILDNTLKEVAGLSNINWDVAQSASAGLHVSDKWTDTPTGVTADNSSTTLSVHDTAGNLLSSKSMTYHVAPITSGGSVNMLYIGDSTVVGGEIVSNLKIHDAADANIALTPIGTQGAPNNHEGYGGKTVDWFYTHADSPFTFSGFWDYAQYLSSNSLATPDVVVVQLGINDVFNKTTDSDVISTALANITKLEAMIASFIEVNRGTKVLLNLLIMPSTQTLMGGDYGVGQTVWRVKRNFNLYNQQLISHAWGRSVTLLGVGLNLDPSTGMVNGVHPNSTGYQAIADGVWAWVKYAAPMDIGCHDSKYNSATRLTTQDNLAIVGNELISYACSAQFSGVGITYRVTEKTSYTIKARIFRPTAVTTSYLGVLLWDGINAVDYNIPTISEGIFSKYLGYLNYTDAIATGWQSKTSTIDLSGAPNFTHMTIHASGFTAGCSGLSEWAKLDLSATSLKYA